MGKNVMITASILIEQFSQSRIFLWHLSESLYPKS